MAAEGESLAAPLLERSAGRRDPFVEVRLYRRGAGPVAIFRSDLSGPRRDRLDVRRIQANHGLRALYAFKPEGSRRGLRIRCDPAAGYSALPFRDGAAIALDGKGGASLGAKGSFGPPANENSHYVNSKMDTVHYCSKRVPPSFV